MLSPFTAHGKDHPRLCGEKRYKNMRQMCEVGSPPPMRGKGISNVCNHKPRGITPAYAGKSTIYAIGDCEPEDHPRLCGEKQREHLKMLEKLGSPPPMRGKVVAAFQQITHYRITPAYAGKSRVPASNRVDMEDHPRLCGEKAM